MSNPERTLIVGASMAGLRTAEALDRAGYSGEITVLGAEPEMPYNRPPLSKGFLNDSVSQSDLFFGIKESLRKVNWKLGAAAFGLDLDARTVQDSEGNEHGFDNLVIATGVSPRSDPAFRGTEQNVYVLRSLSDARALRTSLVRGKRLVIQGAGFIGAEVAAMAVELGLEVALISSSEHMLKRQLGSFVGGEVQRIHESRNVRVFTLSTVTSLTFGSSRVNNVVENVNLQDGQQIECDLFLQATGSIPNIEWLRTSGLDISDGVNCDSTLRAKRIDGTTAVNVFAVGDVARFPNPLFDQTPRRVEQWNIPGECARRVAQEIQSARQRDYPQTSNPFAPVPSFWSDQFDLSLFGMGLPALGERSELIYANSAGKFIVGYYRDDTLVGVCGNGMRSAVQEYRDIIGRKIGSSRV